MGGRGTGSGFSANQPAAVPAGPQNASEAKTFTDLQAYLQSKHHVKMDDSLNALDFQSIRAIGECVDRLTQEFPKFSPALKVVDSMTKNTSTIAQAAIYGTVTVNTKFYTARTTLENEAARGDRSGFHPAGTKADDFIAHELGHVMETALIYHNGRKWSEWNKCTQATRVVGAAARALKKLPEGKHPVTGKPYTIDQMIAQVSRYATHNRSETLAECVADYYRNGVNAKPLSREVWKILKQELG